MAALIFTEPVGPVDAAGSGVGKCEDKYQQNSELDESGHISRNPAAAVPLPSGLVVCWRKASFIEAQMLPPAPKKNCNANIHRMAPF